MISPEQGHRAGPRSCRCTAKSFANELKPQWCPGCGDFGVMNALYRALAAVGRPPHEIAFVSGIGCSSRIPEYTTAYGFNSLHGRALPIAQGIKLAHPELLVLVAGGDADAFSIGGGHFPHAVRRNPDITYLVMDNQVMGQSDGQVSPTSARGSRSNGGTQGSMEAPVNPILYALAYGAHFVAQGIPADLDGLSKLIEEAIRFPGFAFVNIQSPCITFGDPDMQVLVQKSHMRGLQAEGHDASNRAEAMALAQATGKILYTGVFYRNPNPPPSYGSRIASRQRGPVLESAAAVA